VHPVSLSLLGAWSHSYHYRVRGRDALFPVQPVFGRIPVLPGYFLPTNFPEEPFFKAIHIQIFLLEQRD